MIEQPSLDSERAHFTEALYTPFAEDWAPAPTRLPRRVSKKIWVGPVPVGGDSPVSIQSMLVNDTRDVKESIKQIQRLADAGCDIVRLAVPDTEAADALKQILPHSPIPVVADIHFDYRLALASADHGVHAIRINPGNIGSKDFVRKVVNKCREREIPIRIGVNGGSVEKAIKERYPKQLERQLVESALLNAKILEDEGFDQFKISVKASDPMQAVQAYRELAKRCDYPLHLGVTEAGTLKRGISKSAFALGMLLAEGIGDTIRVSLTADSVEEIFAGQEILRSVGLRQEGVNIISCPACGRCEVDLHGLTTAVETLVAQLEVPLTVAVMGCFVNGPGEAEHADVGIAGGIGQYYIFRGETRIRRVPEAEALDALKEEIDRAVLEFKQAHPEWREKSKTAKAKLVYS
ncbi:MAG: flavodoxin-dependent (E)-4-hydroxy-3-methylbut-2-enyl-diphosphate synthase [Vampirovibrio sp.]